MSAWVRRRGKALLALLAATVERILAELVWVKSAIVSTLSLGTISSRYVHLRPTHKKNPIHRHRYVIPPSSSPYLIHDQDEHISA